MIITRQDDREGCRSLVCDSNGIIIAEMVYRCMICARVSDCITDAQRHYADVHIDRAPSPTPLLLGDPSSPEGHRHHNQHNGHQRHGDVHNGHHDDEDDDFDEDGDQRAPVTFSDATAPSDSDSDGGLRGALTLNIPSVPGRRPRHRGGFRSAPDPAGLLSGEAAARGGFVTCAVCDITKFYASVQRRYGQFTCMGCAKFFGRFLLKPRKYCCPHLGRCPLDTSPRCKACLLHACIETYNIDDRRMAIVNANRPLQKSPSSGAGTGGQNGSEATNGYVQQSTQRREVSQRTLLAPRSSSRASAGQSAAQRSAQLKKAAALSSVRALRHLGGHGVGLSASGHAARALLQKKQWGCRKCAGCLVEDCGTCNYCLDKPKYGGANTLKKKCINRKCDVIDAMGGGMANGDAGSSVTSGTSRTTRMR